MDNDVAMLDVLDTAGQEEYAVGRNDVSRFVEAETHTLQAMRDSQIRSGMGFLCVYSITSRESLGEVREFHDRVLQVCWTVSIDSAQVMLKSDDFRFAGEGP